MALVAVNLLHLTMAADLASSTGLAAAAAAVDAVEEDWPARFGLLPPAAVAAAGDAPGLRACAEGRLLPPPCRRCVVVMHRAHALAVMGGWAAPSPSVPPPRGGATGPGRGAVCRSRRQLQPTPRVRPAVGPEEALCLNPTGS